MNDFLKNLPIVSIYYDHNENKLVPNNYAYKWFADYQEMLDIVKNCKYKSKEHSYNPYFNIHYCNETELLVSVYCILPPDIYLILMQEINELKPVIEKSFLFKEMNNEIHSILEATHDDILITDGQGLITQTWPSFEEIYGVSGSDVLGKSVYEMEKAGIFSPSVTAKVLETGQKTTMLQSNKFGQRIVVTATPIKDDNGKIQKVISFSHNVTDFIKLKEQYEYLEKKVELYSAEIEELRSKEVSYKNVIGKSKQLQEVLSLLNRIINFDANVLLCGESGVGKTLFAHLIHTNGNRKNGPFIEVNCGAIPENLLESELFGYEGGAFTGAKREGKPGLIELARGGTLFLDEISELSLSLQVKLLKVIQDKTITRVGGVQPVKVDFRLISATNRNLQNLVHEKQFREDLFYRLNVIPVNVPPLRERKEDIFPLCLFFMERLNNKYSLNKTLANDAIDKLINYEWPGNIRELENVIERILLTSEKEIINGNDLPENIRLPAKQLFNLGECELQDALDQLEKELVAKAYEKHKTTVGVAKTLGISQATAARKIQKYLQPNNE